ncbi:MAG TPA: Na+/H+ antiporter subunit E [Candidatus Competibacteraceae bacterium]|nr:Na+/H+ antiporter subunit E [Candidatus Competibacteraceae bacterium]
MRTFSLFACCILLWLLLSGYLEPWLLGLGLLSCLLVTWLARRMGLADGEGHPIEWLPHVLGYLPWLLKEIAKSSWDVSKRVLDPRLPISPTVVRLRAEQRSTVGRVLFANSITLTPGTLTLRLEGEELEVHALSRAGAEDLLQGGMNRRVAAVEQGVPRPVTEVH